jgi:hypothetical protein
MTMNAKITIAAAAVFLASASAFAADAPAAAAAANAATVVAASALNVPSVSISNNAGRSRAEVHAEAVQFVKNYKTAFAIALEQYKN